MDYTCSKLYTLVTSGKIKIMLVGSAAPEPNAEHQPESSLNCLATFSTS